MTRFAVTLRSRRGFSILELMVVMAILATLVAVLGAGVYGMRKGQAVNAAQSIVNSTLHHARSLAIANNAIYHVRFQNLDTSVNPVAPAAQQYISIYYFPNQAEAFNAVDAADPNIHWDNVPQGSPHTPTNFRGEWNSATTYATDDAVSYTTFPNQIKQVDYYKAGSPNTNVNPSTATTTTTPTTTTSTPTISTWNKVTTNFNLMIARYALPQGTYFGIQYLNQSSSNPSHGTVRRKLLQFQGDGTLRTDIDGGIALFMTDNIALADDQSAADYDTTLQDTRRDMFNEGVAVGTAARTSSSAKSIHVKITQVFQSGLIRDWHPRFAGDKLQ